MNEKMSRASARERLRSLLVILVEAIRDCVGRLTIKVCISVRDGEVVALDSLDRDIIHGEPFCKASCVEARRSGKRSIRRIERLQYGVLGVSWSRDRVRYLPESSHSIGFDMCRHSYAVSSLMDTVYWLSEH
ncbi:hypothetical protein Tco_0478221 [Tanacetum coccineum]